MVVNGDLPSYMGVFFTWVWVNNIHPTIGWVNIAKTTILAIFGMFIRVKGF